MKQNLKRCLSLIAATALSISMLSGCTKPAADASAAPAAPADSSAPASGQPASKKDVSIGVDVQTLQAQVYQIMKDNAEKKAKELGAKLTFQSSELNAATQKSQIETMLAQGVNVLVLEPADAESMAATAEEVKKSGIPVINLEMRIKGFQADLQIVADSYNVGQKQVDAFVEKWGKDKPANVVLLSGTVGDEVAEQISKGVIDQVAKYPNLKLVTHQNCADWDRQKAMNYMEDAIVKNNNAIDVVFANNDNMALGANKAAENAGIADKIWFIGSDNDKELDEGILAGKHFMTIDKGAVIQGEHIAEAAYKLANGEKPTSDKVVDGIPMWYTPTNVVNADTIKEVSGSKFPDLFK